MNVTTIQNALESTIFKYPVFVLILSVLLLVQCLIPKLRTLLTSIEYRKTIRNVLSTMSKIRMKRCWCPAMNGIKKPLIICTG